MLKDTLLRCPARILIVIAAIFAIEAAPIQAKQATGTLLATSSFSVSAYPADTRGDAARLALTTDMIEPSSIARDAAGRIYVTNPATATVTIYAAGANGNLPPIAVIGGVNAGLAYPIAIALDGSGNVYVLDSGLSQIEIFPPLETGTGALDETPTRVIGGKKTRLLSPVAMAIDSAGAIYVANQAGGPRPAGKHYAPGSITVYAAGANGNVKPLARIRGEATGLTLPVAIAVDANGKINVGNGIYTRNTSSFPASIATFAAGATGNVAPLTTISGADTDLYSPNALALDASGNLYASSYLNSVGDAISEYAAGSNGDVAPIATIAGGSTSLGYPSGATLDNVGNLYVSNSYSSSALSGSVTQYAAGANGDTAPTATLTSSFNGMTSAGGIAVDDVGNIYVANDFSAAPDFGSVTVYPSSSYAAGPPTATITGPDTGLDLPQAIAADPVGNLAVLNLGDDSVTEYRAGSTGNALPSATINLNLDGDEFATGLAFDPAGDLVVANQGNENCGKHRCHLITRGSIAVFPSGSTGAAAPSRVIKGADTGLFSPSSLATDQDGEVYVTNYGEQTCPVNCSCLPHGHGSVTVYSSEAKGDAHYLASIRGARTGLTIPYGITVDPIGNIYVLNATASAQLCVFLSDTSSSAARTVAATRTFDLNDPILVFAAGSDGDIAPTRTIGGPLSGLNGASGLIFLPAP